MYGSKLLDILATLDKGEWKALNAFIKSPFFNKNEAIVGLFELLKQAGPVYREDEVDRYLIWSKLFPDRAPEEREIRYLMSAMLRLVEEFLGQQFYKAQKLLHHQHILEACHLRGLKKHYRHYIRQMEKKLENYPFRDEVFYQSQYQLEEIKTGFTLRHSPRSFESSLQATVDSLDDFYLIIKLRLTCELVNRQNIVLGTYDIRLVDELGGFIEGYDFQRVPAVEIHFRILNLLTSPNPAPHFQRLKILIGEKLHLLDLESQQQVFSYAQNFCIKRIKLGEQAFSEELLLCI